MSVFRVVSSGILNQQFAELCSRAEKEGRGAFAVKSAAQIMARLQDEPMSTGEVIYHLKVKKWPVLHVAHAPWSVHYVVDQESNTVYLTKIALLG